MPNQPDAKWIIEAVCLQHEDYIGYWRITNRQSQHLKGSEDFKSFICYNQQDAEWLRDLLNTLDIQT